MIPAGNGTKWRSLTVNSFAAEGYTASVTIGS